MDNRSDLARLRHLADVGEQVLATRKSGLQRMPDGVVLVQPVDMDAFWPWRADALAELDGRFGSDHSLTRTFAAECVQPQFKDAASGQAILNAALQTEASASSGGPTAMPDEGNRRIVFVVHGRNLAARDAMFTFLQAIGLQPLEWNQAVALTTKGAPYIGEILDVAFAHAQAVIVLLTPDEVAYLREEYGSGPDDTETNPAAQARPNVLFEAGMALGRQPDRTVLVELGALRPFSDVAGRHAVHLDNSIAARQALAQRLQTTGCDVTLTGTHWHTAGDLEPPPPPGGGLALGKRVPSAPPERALRIDATWVDRGSSQGRLQITNYCQFDVFDLTFEVPPEAGRSLRVDATELPIARLPSGKTASFAGIRLMGNGKSHFELIIRAKTDTGEAIETTAFVNLTG